MGPAPRDLFTNGSILEPIEIRVGNLVLRQPRPSDLDAVVAACQDPEMSRFIPFLPVPYGVDDARTWLEKVELAWAKSEERTFAIIDEAEGERFQGVVTVRLREGGTLGYWLASWARGRGVMTESLRAVVQWVREEQGIQHLGLSTHPDNAASQRVAERAGFARVGVGKQDDPPFRDGTTATVVYELK
jgi:RimJ/RimL family protein N-acetyltransferase